MISVSDFMYINNIQWNDLLWFFGWLLIGFGMYTTILISTTFIKAKASAIKNILPILFESRIEKLELYNRKLLMENKKLKTENISLSDKFSVLRATFREQESK